MSPVELWCFFPVGYVLTVSPETPVLLVGLSPRHPFGRKLFAGAWLTACTYPIVVLVLPLVFADDPWLYLLVAETFAPVAEVLLFRAAFPAEPSTRVRLDAWRDGNAIVVANLISFLTGLWLMG
jgi:hypothetical protein